VRVRYDRWSGQQEPFGFDVSADAVLAELHDDLLAGMDVGTALERLAQRGFSGRTAGLEELRRRVAEARRRERARMGLDEPLRRVAEQLEDIVERERTAVALSAADDATDRLAELDALPADLAARLSALTERDWEDARAEADFAALLEELRRDVAEATFGRLAGALGSMTPENLESMQALLSDLNAMIAKDARGEDTTEDFEAFRERWGAQLGWDERDDAPADLDELLAELARRMAAMRSMMAGLTPAQRDELANMASQLLDDLDLAFQTDQLQRALEARHPELGWDRSPGEGMGGGVPGGQPSGSLSQTVDWVERLAELDDLAEQLGQDYPGARLEDVDSEALRRGLGDEAVRDLQALREIERVLEEAGAAQRRGGRLELTPRGVRQLGERALARIYDRAVAGAAGSHRVAAGGGDGELTGATRPLAHGDDFRLDVTRTIGNAIMREAARDGGLRPPAPPEPADGRAPDADRGAGRRVRLRASDFELAEAERRVRTTTILMLDMSFSMPLRGNWEHAKRMALALQALVASKFPEDRFHLIGFSDYARQLQPADLLVSGWERVYGTNMQHAFMIARRLLAANPGAEQQLIMVTDGEPTAHLEEHDGQVHARFAWPPEPRTLQLTMQEAARVARTGAALNVFLLDHDPGAAVFVEAMVQRVGGRIFHPDLDDLGHLVVQDFLHRRAG
jgi:uncharacterized protein with von Willebrand factor type A (vWA) domain